MVFDGKAAVWSRPSSSFALPFLGSAVVDGNAFAVTTTPATFLSPSTAILGTADELLDTGVAGTSQRGTGVFGSTTSGVGVRGVANAGTALSGNSESGIGVRGTHGSATGTSPGVLGLTSSISEDATAVLGEVRDPNPGAGSVGVRGVNYGTGATGIGVMGTQAGSGWGVYGRTASGYGVYGVAGSDAGAGVVAAGPTPVSTALQINLGAIRIAGAGVNTSTVAFIHEATAANTPGSEPLHTIIDHPLANGSPDALLFVTQRLRRINGLIRALADQFAVLYDDDGSLVNAPGRWVVVVQDDSNGDLILGDQFNVLILKP